MNMNKIFLFFFLGSIFGSIISSVGFYLYFNNPVEKLDSNQISFFTCPENCENTILYLINHAKKRIYCEMYHISYLKYVDAFIKAKKRGVNVTILVDSESYYCNNSRVCKYYKKAYSILEKNGVTVIPVDKYNLLHSKACLFDDVLFVGSHNFTPTSAKRNREINILIKNDSMINHEFLTVFFEDQR